MSFPLSQMYVFNKGDNLIQVTTQEYSMHVDTSCLVERPHNVYEGNLKTHQIRNLYTCVHIYSYVCFTII